MFTRALRRSLLAAAALGFAAPALAQPLPPPPPPPGMPPMAGPEGDRRPEWHGDHAGMPAPQAPGHDQVAYEQARSDWLAECRRNHGNGNMVGGAIVGGLVGGVIGNRVAGRDNRVVGTVVGGTVGAVSGGAIGSAADRRSANDYCEAYLDRYTTWQPMPGAGAGAVTYGYAPMTVMVPVAYVQSPGQRECTTTVTTEEFVVDEPAPRTQKRTRMIRMIRPPMPVPMRPTPVSGKRVRIN